MFPAENLVCANGHTSAELLIVGRVGHEPGSSGVATKVEVFVPGPGWITIFDVPDHGLDGLTTQCTWTVSSSGQQFGGEILFRGKLR